MIKISRYYKIKYILSNGKTPIYQDKRKKIVKEWDRISILTQEEILKKLKVKDVKLSEIILYDWVGNIITRKEL